MGTGSTVGTVGGAAVGTAIMPGVGTVLGGLAGGLIGGMFDGDKGPPPPDKRNFQMGGNAQTNAAATDLANRGTAARTGYSQTGAANQATDARAGQQAQAQYGGMATTAQQQAKALGYRAEGIGAEQSNALQTSAAKNYYDGDMAQGRRSQQVQVNERDVGEQYAALGGLQQNANTLQQMGTAPMGASYAEAQLRQGQDAAMQQSLAMAKSGRSLGSGAGAMAQAQMQNAQTNQVTNQQAASARIQEQNQFNQFQLGALGQAQQGYGGVANQANAITASNQGVQAQNAQLQQGQQAVNNQTQSTYNQAGAAQAANALGYQQMGQQTGLAYQQMGAQQGMGYNQLGAQQGLAYNQLGQQQGLAYSQLGAGQEQFFQGQSGQRLQSQLNADMAYENLKAGNSIAGMNAATQERGQNLGMMTGMMGAAATMSDRTAKKNIELADFAAAEQRMGAGMARGMRSQADRARLQQELTALQNGSDHQFDPRPAIDLRPAQGYSYEYKDPARHGEGRFYGPMAQDLEKTPAGASTIKEGPDGKKMVDTGRLTLVNTSAVADLQQEMAALKANNGVDVYALDEAQRRQGGVVMGNPYAPPMARFPDAQALGYR